MSGPKVGKVNPLGVYRSHKVLENGGGEDLADDLQERRRAGVSGRVGGRGRIAKEPTLVRSKLKMKWTDRVSSETKGKGLESAERLTNPN